MKENTSNFFGQVLNSLIGGAKNKKKTNYTEINDANHVFLRFKFQKCQIKCKATTPNSAIISDLIIRNSMK